jgi:hypothetical protein
MNAPKAAFDAEYAGTVDAGTMAIVDVVLFQSARSKSFVSVSWLGLQDQTSGGTLGCEERDKGNCEIGQAGEIDGHLVVECCQVNGVWLSEVVKALDSGVEEDAVDVWRFAHYATVM